jgi:hypothetical protein
VSARGALYRRRDDRMEIRFAGESEDGTFRTYGTGLMTDWSEEDNTFLHRYFRVSPSTDRRVQCSS